ncbi:hypothetical protein IE077_004437 [Cardiosporidium cionae]|uniref:Uncharacterized protein n=1 Tax=Cardiosporidium cionae TaxID=476202 RepID=A0ABQ7J9W9_9APIC|nr:hypothetical protein IE077_004437 [Cardiosporidium cionae]|eukprot:KAF8820755.1 hypothetical protein IE077_004437 [Cardiosporidium cionae]
MKTAAFHAISGLRSRKTNQPEKEEISSSLHENETPPSQEEISSSLHENETPPSKEEISSSLHENETPPSSPQNAPSLPSFLQEDLSSFSPSQSSPSSLSPTAETLQKLAEEETLPSSSQNFSTYHSLKRKIQSNSTEKYYPRISLRKRIPLFGRSSPISSFSSNVSPSSSVASREFSSSNLPEGVSAGNSPNTTPEDKLSPRKKSFKNMFGSLTSSLNFTLELKGLDIKEEETPSLPTVDMMNRKIIHIIVAPPCKTPTVKKQPWSPKFNPQEISEEISPEEFDVEEEEDEDLGVFEIGDDDLEEEDSFFDDTDDFESASDASSVQPSSARSNAMDLMQSYRNLVNELNGWNKNDIINLSQVDSAMKQLQTTADGLLVFEAFKVHKQKQRLNKFVRKEVDKEDCMSRKHWEYQKNVFIYNFFNIVSQMDEESFDSLPVDDESSPEEGSLLQRSGSGITPQSLTSTVESEFLIIPKKRWRRSIVSKISKIKAIQEKYKKSELASNLLHETAEENGDEKAGVVVLEEDIPFRVVIKSNRRIKMIKELHTAVGYVDLFGSEDGRKRRIKLIYTDGKENEYDVIANEFFAKTLQKKMENTASSFGTSE